ncbi:uncharacterized protein LOC119275631 isoform X2 [Triticum dicoccoides]|uniref:uncharacterized protein LOC119275631 isoform X2 n=1 Tax=Triticum dicoccoides TaxID=85692 RepID=UPI00188E5B37|nr:uncharacterized protein LOC119275631 isoform X2 [Triticum dicoccoides]
MSTKQTQRGPVQQEKIGAAGAAPAKMVVLPLIGRIAVRRQRPWCVWQSDDDLKYESLEECCRHLEGLAAERQLVLKGLELYNALHPGDEYELAPGKVTRSSQLGDGCCWSHGNIVARRKRSGCFSFLPVPRTLFFFEHVSRADFEGVVTCIPLDEPVTEAYTFLGFRLGWGTRRLGGSDCVCKTCYCLFNIPHPCLKRTCTCGDSRVEKICEMCYIRSGVLHPFRGEFQFGYHK